ncbi:hypothetical protein HF086_012178 [Spodoptera exigua]|uniref:Cytochrome p450 n=1 Tax=Spodoptera exigua TaxID=7107 RepID=A0A922M706_SPOEX|nr:hypothetical protein HF086_012178 [Spodoptera exigua]
MNWLLAVLYVVGGALSASWLVWRYKRRRMLEMASKLPGPTALPLLGNTLVFMSRPEETVNKLEELMQKYGEIYRFWLGPELNIVVRNPAYIRKSVENYFPVFNKECEELAKVISQKEPVTFDCYKDILRSTTQSVNQTLMGLSKEDSEQVYRLEEIIFKTHDMYTLIFNKMTKWWLQVPLIYWLLGKKKQHDYYLKLIDDVMEDIVRRRKKALEDKVYQEIIDVVGPDGPVTNEQLKLLENLDMVYKETLRAKGERRTYGTALIKTLVVWVLRYAKLEPAVSLDNIQLDIAISVTSFHGYNIKARPRNGRINGLS